MVTDYNKFDTLYVFTKAERRNEYIVCAACHTRRMKFRAKRRSDFVKTSITKKKKKTHLKPTRIV